MKLPNDAIRANLRLADPAQRLLWAVQHLIAGTYKSTGTTANTAYDVPLTPANKGILPEFAELHEPIVNSYSANYMPFYMLDTLLLPVDSSLVARGVPLYKCVREISLDAVEPMVLPLPIGDEIPDNSKATTIEQYIAEQHNLLCLDALSHMGRTVDPRFGDATSWFTDQAFFNTTNYSTKYVQKEWYRNDYQATMYPVLNLTARIPRIPVLSGSGGIRYKGYSWYSNPEVSERTIYEGDMTSSPYNVCTPTKVLQTLGVIST